MILTTKKIVGWLVTWLLFYTGVFCSLCGDWFSNDDLDEDHPVNVMALLLAMGYQKTMSGSSIVQDWARITDSGPWGPWISPDE